MHIRVNDGKRNVLLLMVLLLMVLVYGCASSMSPRTVKRMPPKDVPPPVMSVSNTEKVEIVSPVVVQETVPEEKTVKDENPGEEGNGEKAQNLLDTALELAQSSQEFWSNGELDKAVETLDQAYSIVLKVDTNKHPELFQQKEDLRFTISKRILEIYASRFTAVDGNHNAIPLVMNRYVEDEIRHFQTDERDFFIESYKRSGLYRKKIVKALKDAGLPAELSWLPLIESGFKVNALSPARALGLWQFIPSTGYKYGLNRDNWIDERLDPEKATNGAIDYLTELHDMFGDWTTVLAGYNCGEARVLRLIREQKINYLDNFWDLYERLPRETARYVPRFIATLHIINDPGKYGFNLGEPYAPVYYDTVSVEKQIELKKLAEAIGISPEGLHSLNPELRREITPQTLYDLNVPEGKSEELLARLDDIPAWSPSSSSSSPGGGVSGYAYHKVRSGETLSLIASKYRTSVDAIIRSNNIRKKSVIRAGQQLRIPSRGSSGRTYASKSSPSRQRKYHVQRGDSLWLIAKKFDTDTKTLIRMNNLRNSRLSVGQTLQVAN